MSSPVKEELLLKIVLVGDSGVGKSNILSRYVHNFFNEEATATLGVELMHKRIQEDNLNVNVQFWDTAGQERFRSLTNAYYRNANGAVVVFDISAKESFRNLGYWIAEVKKNTSETPKIIILGNKSDLASQRQVSVEEARAFADSKGFFYTEVSAKVNYENKVHQCLEILARDIVKDMSKENMHRMLNEGRVRKDNARNVQQSKSQDQKTRAKCCQYI